MLESLRRSATSVFSWLILGALALVFGLQFGLPSDSLTFGKASYVKVHGESIGDDEYRYQMLMLSTFVEFDKLDERIRKMIGVDEEILESLIEREVLTNAAHDLGLEATERDAEDLVLAGHFIVLGETLLRLGPKDDFNYDYFLRFVRSLGVSEQRYLDLQRRELLARMVRDLVASSVAISERELRQIYDEGANRLSLRVARYSPMRFGELVDPTTEEIAAYQAAHTDELKKQYAAQGSRFAKLPKQARVWILEVRKPDAAAKLDAKPDDAKPDDAKPEGDAKPEDAKPKDDAKPKGETKPKGDAKKDDAKKDDARAAIEQARKRIVGGEDFRAVARELSQHETASRGGEVGWVGETVGTGVDAQVDAALAGLELGEVSQPIDGEQAYYLVLVRHRREGDIAEADALPELAEEGVRTEKGEQLARAAAEEDLAAIKSGAAFADVFAGGSALGGTPGIDSTADRKRVRVELDETGSFPKGEPIPGLGPAADVVAAAWAAEPDNGLLDGLFEVGPDIVLVGLVDKKAATDAGFAEIRADLYRSAAERKGALVSSRWTHRLCLEAKGTGEIKGSPEQIAKLIPAAAPKAPVEGEAPEAGPKPYEICDRVGNRGGMLRMAAGLGSPGDE